MFQSVVLNNHGDFDVFVLKINSQGTVQWGISVGGNGRDQSSSIVSSSTNVGVCYVTGSFSSVHASFGSISLTNQGKMDIFVFAVQGDTQGTISWAVSAGSSDDEEPKQITNRIIGGNSDYQNQLVLTGYYRSQSLIFGSQPSLMNVNPGNADIFVALVNPSDGTFLKSLTSGGTQDDVAEGISCDGQGNVYITGWYYSNPALFGSFSLPNTDLSATTSDLFVTRLDNSSDLNIQWVEKGYGLGEDYSTGIAVGDDGIYMTGTIWSRTLTYSDVILDNLHLPYTTSFVVQRQLENSPLNPPQPVSPSENKGTAIALGVLVPVLLVVAIIAGCLYYRRKKTTVPEEEDYMKLGPDNSAL